MSLGPDTKEQKIKISKFDRLHNATKKIVKEYFERPLYYLFYGTLLITILVLIFGYDIKWELWVILGILGIREILFYLKIV